MNIFTIIVAYNNYDITVKCLEAIKKQTLKSKLVLVNNGSDKEQTQLFNKLNVDFIINVEKNYGFASGCNEGITFCLKKDCNLIWIVTNDCFPNSDVLSHLLDKIKTKKIHCASSSLRLNNNIQSIGLGKINWITGLSKDLTNNKNINNFFSSYYLNLACVLIKSEVFNKIGLLDSKNFYLYFEDIDFSIRLNKFFKFTNSNQAITKHLIAQTTNKMKNTEFIKNYEYSSVIFLKKHFKLWFIPFVISLFLRSIKRFFLFKYSIFLSGLIGGIKGSFKKI